MADASASALFDVLLSGPAENGSARLTAAIERDPGLALWSVVCRAASGAAVELRTPAALARWLAECALDLLAWPEAEEPALDDSDPGEVYRRLTIEAVETAELAKLLASAERGENEASQEAYLAGLLHGADAWLALDAASRDGIDVVASGGRQPPGWNAKHPNPEHLNAELGARRPEQQAAPWNQGADAPRSPLPIWRLERPNAAVSLACEILAGRRPLPPALAFDREAIAASMQGPGDSTESSTLQRLLPALVRKLARLRRLETAFDERLETEKLEAMAEFAAGAGHEINNPIAVIAGRAQLFLRDERDPERRRELAVMNGQAMRVYEMIADMMLFARPPTPKPSACDISQLLDKLLGELGPEAVERQIELRREGSRDSLVIQADGDQLSVALRALIENAIEAVPNGGRVEVILSRPCPTNGKVGDHRQEIEIVVRDNGPGIPPEIRRHLFDPFYSGRGAGRGLGLGLSKCWRIVANHGGRIEVESEVGRGATFKIRLPIESRKSEVRTKNERF
ncbi:MAG TPA: HAMP domain-containing sensor histidine kinase [Pirellulales bacterium]|nr:HAMP domain-containing sensor histidine kinase [Pirellulales bacterium]